MKLFTQALEVLQHLKLWNRAGSGVPQCEISDDNSSGLAEDRHQVHSGSIHNIWDSTSDSDATENTENNTSSSSSISESSSASISAPGTPQEESNVKRTSSTKRHWSPEQRLFYINNHVQKRGSPGIVSKENDLDDAQVIMNGDCVKYIVSKEQVTLPLNQVILPESGSVEKISITCIGKQVPASRMNSHPSTFEQVSENGNGSRCLLDTSPYGLPLSERKGSAGSFQDPQEGALELTSGRKGVPSERRSRLTRFLQSTFQKRQRPLKQRPEAKPPLESAAESPSPKTGSTKRNEVSTKPKWKWKRAYSAPPSTSSKRHLDTIAEGITQAAVKQNYCSKTLPAPSSKRTKSNKKWKLLRSKSVDCQSKIKSGKGTSTRATSITDMDSSFLNQKKSKFGSSCPDLGKVTGWICRTLKQKSRYVAIYTMCSNIRQGPFLSSYPPAPTYHSPQHSDIVLEH